MKIEMGESLVLSWLRHVKECQIVQTNWKASSSWELKNKELLTALLKNSRKIFKDKYGYDLFKKNSGLEQILTQSETDVLGVAFNDENMPIYAVDVAFHEAGLNYGPKEETVSRVIEKCIRSAMCIYGYFGYTKGTIIFASPKINPACISSISECINDVHTIFSKFGLEFQVRIIANDDFSESILQPVLNIMDNVADTSELFMRSLQMYNLFAQKKTNAKVNTPRPKIDEHLEQIDYTEPDIYQDKKVGTIAQEVLRPILESGNVSEKEIELMQTKEYSKETFDIQYPLLLRGVKGTRPKRYYANPLTIKGTRYYLCSEWFEVKANNDRPYLIKWLKLNQIK